MAELNISFIQKCFEKWLEENPDGTYPQFILLCKMWRHAHEDIYGEVKRYVEIGDKQKVNSLYETNVDYKKLYEERLKEKPKKQELDSAYGKFTKTPKQMFDEGWCKDCLGDISKCLKKGVCEI